MLKECLKCADEKCSYLKRFFTVTYIDSQNVICSHLKSREIHNVSISTKVHFFRDFYIGLSFQGIYKKKNNYIRD